ncbi:MAG TPA: S9 family peptidase [Candidatus Megaira endosymbiont of Nemacystus decipiens]|nr:S9 family peptidase [Candidatus Megaera endosymbiont of Nemacystus decipiens]
MSNITNAQQIIPREVLFSNPEKISVRLSQDGKYISYVAPLSGVLNVWVAPIDDLSKAEAITEDKKRGVRSYSWSKNNNYIIYAQDNDGDENARLYSINIKTKNKKLLTPEDGVKAMLLKTSLIYPNKILVSHNRRDKQFFDIYEIDILTGEEKLVFNNIDNYLGFIINDLYELVVAMKMLPDGTQEYYYFSKESNKPSLLQKVVAEDMLTTSFGHISSDGKTLYIIDSTGRNNSALFEMNIATKERKKLFEDEKEEIDDYLTSPQSKKIQAVATNYMRKEWYIIDESIREDFELLNAIEDGDLEIVSRSYDDTKWVVVFLKSDAPFRYYLYERNVKKAKFLFSSNSKQDNLPFSKMRPLRIKSRDGLGLVSYLTVPNWLEDENLYVKSKVPLVLLVHGGPNARDHWGFSQTVQWLANRGYAVLQVNYRGSTGFGKKFVNAGDGQWAENMQRDLEDALHWAVAQGITTKEQIAIMGGSYGGYATLVGMTMTPDLYAAGIDIVGMSNLETFKDSIPPYWKPAKAHLDKMLGFDSDSEEGKAILKKKSPINYVDNIKKPLMIVQGANDPRVVQSESEQIVKVMEEKNIPFKYLLYPDEGHGLLRPENKISMYAHIEVFLSEVFSNTRFEPNNNKFPGSSLQIKDSQ